MDLKNVHTLIDGYNLQLPYGTGIKTYAQTLIRALTRLGADVGILFSKNINISSNNPILGEVLFYDIPPKSPSRLASIKEVVKATTGVFYMATKVQSKGIVIKKDYDINKEVSDSTEVFNLNDCYRISHLLYKYLRIRTVIRIPSKLDIWHSTYPLPITIKDTKKITTIHDLVPLRLPYTTLDNKRLYYKILKQSLKESAIIITPSEHTKRDILNFFEVNPEKVYVTYEAVGIKPLSYGEETVSSVLKKYRLSIRDYVLFVGAIEPKKNVGRLIEAYSLLDTDMPLVIVGKKAWLWEAEVAKLELYFGKDFPRKVRMLDFLPTDDLTCLYAGAYCFVFPSLYEGFGLPPLEAMSLGCPVITSNVSSLPEICGDAALYVDPYNVYDIREKIGTLLNDHKLRDRLSQLGQQRANLFSMENYVKKVYEAYRKIL